MKELFTLWLLVVSVFATFFSSCTNGKNPGTVTKSSTKETLHLVRITYPINGTMIDLADVVNVEISFLTDSITPDSVILFVGNNKVGPFEGKSFALSTNDFKVGTHQIRAAAWYRGEKQTASVAVKVKSNIIPSKLSYRIVNTFPHDMQAYTQGLFFFDGNLIESTGQNGESSLRRVELKTGKVIQSVNLERQYFGEGATLFNDKIYQLTWTSRKGFVYDAKTFSLIHSFDYPTQGWGLVRYNDNLIMSDGSNILYIVEPESFTEISRLEVYDNNGPVYQLNELELINGKVWANVYQTDKVAIIDPETGIVLSYVDFSGLLTEADIHRRIDVLNGIAWDEKGNRLFVTGKYWPKLFEVEVY